MHLPEMAVPAVGQVVCQLGQVRDQQVVRPVVGRLAVRALVVALARRQDLQATSLACRLRQLVLVRCPQPVAASRVRDLPVPVVVAVVAWAFQLDYLVVDSLGFLVP